VLSRAPIVESADSDAGARKEVLCRPPNQYARNSLKRMVARSLGGKPVQPDFIQALHSCDHAAFTTAAVRLLESVPNSALKRSSGGDEVSPRESLFQTALYMAIVVGLRTQDSACMESATQRGRADIVVHFRAKDIGGSDTVWIIELGIDGSKAGQRQKLHQAQDYARSYSEKSRVYCCALAVSPPRPASKMPGGHVFSFVWSRRVSAGVDPRWEDEEVRIPMEHRETGGAESVP